MEREKIILSEMVKKFEEKIILLNVEVEKILSGKNMCDDNISRIFDDFYPTINPLMTPPLRLT